MDQTLALKLEEFGNALRTLEEALAQPKNNLARDSAIKRFEYTFELAWKTSKRLLREQFGVDVFASKECFRALRASQMLTDEETELCLAMADDRNEAVLTYSENFANELYEKISNAYVKILRKIYTTVQSRVAF